MDKELIYEVLYRYKVVMQEDLPHKEEFKSFVESITDEVFTEFYKILAQETRYKGMVKPEVIPYLVNRQKDFVKMWLFAEVDKNFADSVMNVIEIHHFIGLNDIDMMYGANLISFLINIRLSKYSGLSDHDKAQWMSYILNRIGLLQQLSEKIYDDTVVKGQKDKEKAYQLYDLVEAHLKNLNKVLIAFKNDVDFSGIEIAEDIDSCPIQKMIDEMFEFKVIDGTIYRGLNFFHKKWHDLYKSLKTNKNRDLLEDLKKTTDDMMKFLSSYYSYDEDIFFINMSIIVKEFIDLNLNLLLILNKNLSDLDVLDKYSIEDVLRKSLFLYNHIIKDFEVFELEELKQEEFGKYEKSIGIYSSDKSYVIKFVLSDVLVHLAATNEKVEATIDPLLDLTLGIIKLLFNYRNTLAKSKELLVKAESYAKSKDIFLANMSHELRTPLNAIIGFSQILSKRKDIPENLKSYIEKINTAGKTLLELINNVLDFAKIESGKIQLKPSRFEIDALFEEVRTIIDPLAKGKQIRLEIQNELEDKNVNLDYSLMKQVLMNLLSNAVKFTPEGGQVTIEAKSADNDSHIQISVCDTGVGISREDINKLFQPFSQVENPMQKSVKGTGLGLVIIKRIVEMHGGKIWVESELGKGTCFRFVVPKDVELTNLILELNIGKEYTVVLLEDDKLFGNIMADCLKYDFNLIWISSIGAFEVLLNKIDKDKTFFLLDYFVKEGVSSSLFDKIDRSKAIVLSSEDRLADIPDDIKFINKSYASCKDIKSQILRALQGERCE